MGKKKALIYLFLLFALPLQAQIKSDVTIGSDGISVRGNTLPTLILNCDTCKYVLGIGNSIIAYSGGDKKFLELTVDYFGWNSAYKNVGVAGTISTDWVGIIGDTLTRYKPNLVFFDVGTNDPFSFVYAQESIANIKRIIDSIVVHGAIPVYLQIPASNLRSNQSMLQFDTVNTAIQAYLIGKGYFITTREQMAIKRVGGSPTPPADNLYDIKMDGYGFSYDSLHYIKLGNEMIFRMFYLTLRNVYAIPLDTISVQQQPLNFPDFPKSGVPVIVRDTCGSYASIDSVYMEWWRRSTPNVTHHLRLKNMSDLAQHSSEYRVNFTDTSSLNLTDTIYCRTYTVGYYTVSRLDTVYVANQYQAETYALLSRMSVQPPDSMKAKYDTIYISLKVGNRLGKLDFLHIYAMHDRTDSKLNWISTSFNATEVGTLTWTQYEGFKGNGTDARLNTGFVPYTGTHNFTQNSASLGVYNRTSTYSFCDIGTLNSYILAGNFAVTATSPISCTQTDYSGMKIVTRVDASTLIAYINNSQCNTDTRTSEPLQETEITILSQYNNDYYSDHQLGAAFAGGSLTAEDVQVISDALNHYFTSIGKNVY